MADSMLVACKSCHRQYDVTGMRPGEHVRCGCGRLLEVPTAAPVHDARILHCSGCGGKVRERADRCEYCGGVVSLADRGLGPACPECYARLVAGASFCCECGVRIEPRAHRGVRASASCPRCGGSLIQRETSAGPYTDCAGCGGIWLEAKHFEDRIARGDLESLGAAIGEAPGREAVAGKAAGRQPEDVRYVPCPVCGNLMHRKNFAGCSGVVIDWCKGHGFWFDTDELEKVIRFVQSGGLDRSRQLQIERAKGELARIEARKRSAASRSGAPWGYHGDRSVPEWSLDLGGAIGALLRGLLG